LIEIISNFNSGGEKKCEKNELEYVQLLEPEKPWKSEKPDFIHFLNAGTGLIKVPLGATVRYRLKSADFEER
jgi:hypothetical protein